MTPRQERAVSRLLPAALVIVVAVGLWADLWPGEDVYQTGIPPAVFAALAIKPLVLLTVVAYAARSCGSDRLIETLIAYNARLKESHDEYLALLTELAEEEDGADWWKGEETT